MTIDKKRKKKAKSKQRGEFKVVFKGQLLPGFDKEQVVLNITRLTKLPPEKIEKKFFSGKVVIIRRANDEAYAQKLQQLFTRAGLEVFILKDMTRQIEPHAELPSAKSKKLKKLIKRNTRSIIAAVVFVVLFVVGMELWNKYNINVEAPDDIVHIEYSLANKPLLFLAHINLERLLSRQNYFVTDSDVLPGTDTTLYRQLKTAGIEPEKSIRQILTTAYIEDQQLISQSIFLGHFNVDSVKKFFVKHYHGELLPDADFIRLRISPDDENSCEQGSFMELSIEPERILISTYGHLNELHQLLSLSPGKVTDLSNWQQYQNDKLVSVAFFNQSNIKTAQQTLSNSGLTGIMAQNLSNRNKSMDSIYASVGLQLLPPSGLFDVTVNSTDQAWLKQTQSDLNKLLEDMKHKSFGLLNLQLLLGKIAFQQNTQPDLRENADGDIAQLSMAIEIDSEFRQSIELSVNELLEMLFSLDSSMIGIESSTISRESSTIGKESSTIGKESSTIGKESSTIGIESSTAGKESLSTAQQEKLDTTPLKYRPQYKPSEIKPFNETLDKFFNPAWIEGPFAIAIDELLLESHEDGDQVLLQLRGKAQNIDNAGRQQAKLTVTEVTDQRGKNLLDKMKCSQSAADNEFFTSLGGVRTAYQDDEKISYNELEVRQKVKLKKGIKFSQVKSLKGKIELNLATQTQSKQFAKTEQNKIVTEFDSRILFKPSAADTLSYAISGNEKQVLTVRALNKKKDYLSRISRTSIGNLLGRGHSLTEKYRGEIAFIEIVYAAQLMKIDYPFFIAKFPPYPMEEQWKFESQRVKLSSVASWLEKYQDLEPLSFTETLESNRNGAIQASWHNGPLNLGLYALTTSKHFGTTGQLLIKTPLIDELRHNLSALQVYFRYPRIADNGDTGRSYYYPLKAKGYYMNGEFIADKDKPYMDGQLAFTLPYRNEQTPLTEINGDIIVHLPISKHGSSYTDMSIGAQWEDEGVRTKIVRLSNEIMEFEVLSNRDRLLQITLINSKNERISTTDIQHNLDRQGRSGNIIVNYHGVPVKAILTVSEGQQTKRYPFKLNLD